MEAIIKIRLEVGYEKYISHYYLKYKKMITLSIYKPCPAQNSPLANAQMRSFLALPPFHHKHTSPHHVIASSCSTFGGICA
jgi:hypothetical protein